MKIKGTVTQDNLAFLKRYEQRPDYSCGNFFRCSFDSP
jgi:hypothetical protein